MSAPLEARDHAARPRGQRPLSLPDDLLLESVEPKDLLADRVYHRLRQAVIRNEIRAGVQLSVPELARRMNVSRSPVREAVQRLIHDGLAEHVPHRGAVVSETRVEDFLALLDVRELLEGLAARLAASTADADSLAKVTAVLTAHEGVIHEADAVTNVEFDMAFHKQVRTAAGNPHLDMILDRIQTRSHLSLHHLWGGEKNPRRSLDEHSAIRDAIASGDPVAAEEAARRHIVSLRERVVEDLQQRQSSDSQTP